MMYFFNVNLRAHSLADMLLMRTLKTTEVVRVFSHLSPFMTLMRVDVKYLSMSILTHTRRQIEINKI